MSRAPKKRTKDKLDLEGVETLLENRGWRLFSQRVHLMIQRTTAELEKDADEKTTTRLRARVQTLREVLGIPAILAGEARKDIEASPSAEED